MPGYSLLRSPADMGRQHNVVQIQQWIVWGYWMGRKNVESRTGQMACLERVNQCRFIHRVVGRSVNDPAGRFRRRQMVPAE